MIERAASYKTTLGLSAAAAALLLQGCTADDSSSPDKSLHNASPSTHATNARCWASKQFGNTIQAKVYHSVTGERMQVETVQVQLENAETLQEVTPDELGRARFDLPTSGFHQIFIHAVVDGSTISCDTRFINRG